MVKIRSKRNRQERPLLNEKLPMLSDELPPDWDQGDPSYGATSRQPGAHEKKGPWKKIFGKGSRKKSGEDGHNLSIDEGINISREELLHTTTSINTSAMEDLTIDPQIHVSQETKGSDRKEESTPKLKHASPSPSRAHGEREEVDLSPTIQTKEVSTPTSTKSTKSTRSKSLSFVRSLKKRSTQESLASSGKVTPSPSSKVSTAFQQQDAGSPSSSSRSSFRRSLATSSLAKKSTPSPASMPQSFKSHKDESSGASHGVKKILSRPFGREHILTTEQIWVVHVSRAEWDANESLWKYRMRIQRREGNKLQDFASCFTLRSLEDFHWLEQSLETEFDGGLLLPRLSIYLGLPNISICQHEVDSQLLSNWMNDILNGVRGQGELMFPLTTVDIATSESMEAFLYRSDLVGVGDLGPSTSQMHINAQSSKNKSTTKSIFGGDDAKWNFFPELCYTDCVAITKPIKEAQSCQSPSLGTATTFNIQADSFVEAGTFDDLDDSLVVHTDLLKAERDLILSWRSRALQSMEKLRILKEQENYIGTAWKRFAISVSNLFAYEKDIETARLGDSKSRRDLQIPYRKLQKSVVDDCLRILTRHKMERATPALDAINALLGAYVADLSTVQPSVVAYMKGIQKLSAQKSMTQSKENESRPQPSAMDTSGTLADKIQEGLKVVTKQLTSNMGEDFNAMAHQSTHEDHKDRQRRQLQTTETRLLRNEVLLKEYLTMLCKTAPVRTSRMIYAHLENEIEQSKALRDAAMDLNLKINVSSKETLSKMIHRHHIETKEDKETEIKLVHRIVNIGNTKKFVREEGKDGSEEVEHGVELSIETAQQESEKMNRRDKAMSDCRSRIGRWDAKLAMAMMEAVGVTDANVRVEETTRDLRMVRKYAIGLRENVERCAESLEELRMAILQGGLGDIRDVRTDFTTEFQKLLSLTYIPTDEVPSDIPTYLLEKEGINLSDPAGWLSKAIGSCGNALSSYTETRDSGTEWLLESLGELLKEYNRRVEEIESFVYMECVGIQLEKHFSHVRASALTAFEKKTDITSAINIATRKKMPVLVKELQEKLDKLGPVSHTNVKEAKEAHLESKALKQELHMLAMRRLARARETSTERVIALMTVWAKEEEGCTTTELGIQEGLTYLVLESMRKEDLRIYVEASPARI